MTRALVTQLLEALELHAKQYPHMQKGYTVDAITAARAYLATEPSSERAEVAERLRCIGRLVSYSDVYTKAADMLEADAQHRRY